MAFYIRKSFRLGPVRLNLSKGGLGASVGVRGARVGMTSRGRPYVHAGRGGIYMRRYLGGGSKTDARRSPSVPITLYEDTGVTYPSGVFDPDQVALTELEAAPPGGTAKPWLLGGASLIIFALALAVGGGGQFVLFLAGAASLVAAMIIGAREKRRTRARERLHELLAESTADGHPLSGRSQAVLREALGDPSLTDEDRRIELENAYLAALRRIVDDGYATRPEVELLDQLEEGFGLDPERCAAARVDAFRGVWLQAVADHELTAEEESSLAQLRAALRIPGDAIVEELTLAARLAELRRILEGELPVIEPTHPLRRGEVCHFEGPARLLRERNLRTFQRDGQRYRVQGFVIDREGMLLVTDRRLLLIHSGTTAIPMNRIVDLEVDVDRSLVRITRDDRKNPTILTIADAERVGALIAAVVERG